MSPQEFASVINTFNEAVYHTPPPPNLSSSLSTILFACFSTLVILIVIASIHYTHHLSLILIIPSTFLLLTTTILAWRRRLKKRFERAMLDLCSCMNATENVRGINVRFTKFAPGNHPSFVGNQKPPNYAITIEFDERYNLLHHFTTGPVHPLPPYKLGTLPPSYTATMLPTLPENTYQEK
ncbi:hypothetical protein BC940DRAFT_349804 [Gongronella butleri]|nr:hypothetical protein BC940DRAFT_349804 [Gongronella butleri]